MTRADYRYDDDPDADYDGAPTAAENEALLIRRLICEQCDKFHHDTQDAGCTNPSCQCWCRE